MNTEFVSVYNKEKLEKVESSILLFCVPSRDVGPTPIPLIDDIKYNELSRLDDGDITWFVVSNSRSILEQEFLDITNALYGIITHPYKRNMTKFFSIPRNLDKTKQIIESFNSSYENSNGIFLNHERKNELVEDISTIIKPYIFNNHKVSILVSFLLNDELDYELVSAIRKIVKLKRKRKTINQSIVNESLLLAKSKSIHES